MPKIKAALFDVDGTLLDSKEYIFRAYEHTARAHKIRNLTRDKILSAKGATLEQTYRLCAPRRNPKTLCETHHQFQLANDHLVTPYENAADLLERLYKSGIKLGVITNRKQTAIDGLKKHRLYDYFDIVLTAQHVINPKPHPEPIFKALDYLGIDPYEAVMIGDMEADIAAGKGAGTMTVAVTHGFCCRDDFVDHEPDHFVDDLFQLQRLILPHTRH